MPVKHDASVGVNTAEDAIELLRRQKERQASGGMPQQMPPQQQQMQQMPPQQMQQMQQQQMQQQMQQMQQPPRHQVGAGYNEPGSVNWLRGELEKCASNIRTYGEPPPQHAARFLLRFGQELLQFLPNPPPDVKAQVLSSFAQVGWDVRIRQPLKGSHPPNGQQLTSLAFGLCCFFSHRNDFPLPPPEAGIIQHVPRPAAPVAQPQQQVRGAKGGGGKGDRGAKGGGGGGKGACHDYARGNCSRDNCRFSHDGAVVGGGKGDRRVAEKGGQKGGYQNRGGKGGGSQSIPKPRPSDKMGGPQAGK